MTRWKITPVGILVNFISYFSCICILILSIHTYANKDTQIETYVCLVSSYYTFQIRVVLYPNFSLKLASKYIFIIQIQLHFYTHSTEAVLW